MKMFLCISYGMEGGGGEKGGSYKQGTTIQEKLGMGWA